MNNKLYKIIAVSIFAFAIIGNITITIDKHSLDKTSIIKLSQSINSNAELLPEICVNDDRYGQGNSLTWFIEGDDICYFCDKTGNCDDDCHQWEEICYNLCHLYFELCG